MILHPFNILGVISGTYGKPSTPQQTTTLNEVETLKAEVERLTRANNTLTLEKNEAVAELNNNKQRVMPWLTRAAKYLM